MATLPDIDWLEFYLGLTLAVARKSKDTTKHGCIITSRKHKILGLGFNGPPEGFPDDEMPTHREHDMAPNKYDTTIHAEVNAVNNKSAKIKKGIAYVSGIACPPCLIHLYQNGVRDVYMIDKTSVMLDERSAKVTKFLVEKSTNAKYGKLNLFYVKPNLSWLEILGEDVSKLREDGVLCSIGA